MDTTTLSFTVTVVPPTGIHPGPGVDPGAIRITSGLNSVVVPANVGSNTLELAEDNSLNFTFGPVSLPTINFQWIGQLNFTESPGWTLSDEGITLDSNPKIVVTFSSTGSDEIGIIIVGTTELDDTTLAMQSPETAQLSK